MRIAQLGAGRIGAMHADILSSLVEPGALLVADVDSARARDVAAAVGAEASEIETAIATADALVIAASSTAHPELIRAGIERGIPVFCEKPLATGLQETKRLVEDIDRSNVRFQLGFQRRFDAAYREARRLVEDGTLGRLYVVRLAGHDPAPPHEAYIPLSGGIFNDFSVHDFDVTRWLTGEEIEEVYADGAVLGFPVFAKYDDVDTAVATLRLSGGTRAILSATRHDPLGYDIRTELFGSGDSVSIGLGPRTPMRSLEPGIPPPAGPAWSMFIDRFRDAYENELRAFLRVARGEEESACTARDGLEAVRVAVAATRSLREHRPVRVAEVT
ncbi:MAG: Gfo/Idh/MocA family oxidoreductase [Chloroflexota bacterium]|nr:Gfo/Idh/MocA family oxidoreductase [Chloroflexota bacterium]